MIYRLGMSESLPALIKHRIETAYGGSQAAFARSIGATQQTVSAWINGKVSLPQADARRRLARELGISHVQLFVLAGELTEEEAGPPAPPPFSADDPRAAIVAALQTVSPAEAALILPVVHSIIHAIRGDTRGAPTPIR